MHTEMVGKLRLMGKNAVFGLRMNITVGESHLIAMATGTAVCLAALLVPPITDTVTFPRHKNDEKEMFFGVLQDDNHRLSATKAFEHLSQLAFHRKYKSTDKSTSNGDSKHSTPEHQQNMSMDSRDPKRNLDLSWDKDAIIAEVNRYVLCLWKNVFFFHSHFSWT